MTTATETQSANLEATDQPEKIVYTITEVCGRLLISPGGKPQLPPRLMDALLQAMAGVGDIDEAIQAAEDHWQITDFDRVQAMEIAGLDTGQIKATVGLRLMASRGRFRRGTHFRDEVVIAPTPPLRDPDIVRFIQAKAEKAAALIEGIATLEARADKRALRQAKVMRRELRAIQASIENAREVELQRDAEMGEARDPLIRAKMRGHVVTVKEAETADFARDEHGARIINRRGPARGLPALVYSRGTRTRILTGIHHAFDAGHLDNPRTGSGGEALLEVGQAYEAAYAKSDPLKAVDPSQVGGGGFGPRGPQAAAVEAAEWLSIARDGLTPRQRAALDLICGEGHTLGGAARRIGAGVPSMRRALCGGLAQVARSHAEHAERVRAREVVTVGARLRMGASLGV